MNIFSVQKSKLKEMEDEKKIGEELEEVNNPRIYYVTRMICSIILCFILIIIILSLLYSYKHIHSVVKDDCPKVPEVGVLV